MKTYSREQLQEVIRRHGLWLRDEAGGERADLRYSDLSGSNLSDSNLSYSDLRGSNLSEAKDGAVCRMDFGGWSICIRSDKTSIGCQAHSNEEWLGWMPNSEEIAEMHPDAPAWWATHGEAIKAAIRCVMAKAAGEAGKDAK